MKKVSNAEIIPGLEKILKETPLKTRLKVSNEMAFISLLTELGYREEKAWTEDENEILSKLCKSALAHTEHQLEQIAEFEQDNLPDPKENLDKIEQRIELNFFYSGDLTEEKVVSEIMSALRKADPGCFIGMTPIKSDEEKEKELNRITEKQKEYVEFLKKEIAELKDRIKAQTENVAYNAQVANDAEADNFKHRQEIERLKGLIKEMYGGKEWKKFQEANNL